MLSTDLSFKSQQVANNNCGFCAAGLCTGVLTIAIVMPQMVIAIGAGPWDELFGKGNIPAFALASVFAFSSAVAGMIMLPKMPKSSFRSVSMGGGH
jgi:solute carrier family 45 protein 1/2/4